MNWDELRRIDGVECYDPASESDLRRLPVVLPSSHLEFLRATNGLVSGNGYVRIVGVGGSVRDQVWWNAPNTWRFSARADSHRFWFIADVAHGAQFAYEFDEIGGFKDWVVYVDQLMTPRFVLPNFEEFIQRAVIECPREPLDSEFSPVLKGLGVIPPNKIVVPVPHPCIAECDSPSQMLMEASAAMILEGDLLSESERIGSTPDGTEYLDTYIDLQRRTRFRISRRSS